MSFLPDEDQLPAYESQVSVDQHIQTSAETGFQDLDAARQAARALVERTSLSQHHKSNSKDLADQADAIMFAVAVSALHRPHVPEEVASHIAQLQRLTSDANALFDEISEMGAAKRNLNRSWTEYRLHEILQKLNAVSAALQIRDGRCGLIEEIFAQPMSPASPTRSSSSSVWSVDFWRRMSNF